MKTRSVLIILLFIVAITKGFAQEKSLSGKTALGFQLKQNQRDFGIGINLTSPYFASQRVAVRLKANIMWGQYPDNQDVTTWMPYSNLSLGVVGVGGEMANMIRLYGEGGVVVLFPSNGFSEKSTVFGGYGLFGFEFVTGSHVNYFIEIGGIGTGAVADKIAEKPVYSNGMIINTGFRVYF